jgi:alpha-glucosidase
VAWEVARRQYNLIGSHDTARIQTVLGGDDGRVRAAFGAVLTYVGVPSILYGDEIGLDGHEGGEARRTMPWDEDAWDLDRLAFVQRLVRFRVRSDALAHGGFQVIEIGDDHFAYLRDTDESQIIVVIVRGPGSRPAGPLPARLAGIADGTAFTELLSHRVAAVADGGLPVGPTPPGVAIWVSGRDVEVAADV